MSDSSKTDPPLAKANSGNTSVITYLRRGKGFCATGAAIGREGWEYVRETTMPTPRSVKKEGEEVLQAPEQRFLCKPWKSTVEQISTCSLGSTQTWRRVWPHGQRAQEQDLGRTCGSVERVAHAGAGLLAGLVTPWGGPCWNTLILKDCTPWKGPMLVQIVKNCSTWEELTLEKFMEDCLPSERSDAGAEEEREKSSPWGGRSNRDNVWWTDRNPPLPIPLQHLRGRRQRKLWVNLSSGRREGWAQGVLRFGFVSHYPALIWLAINSFPHVESVLLVVVIGEWSLPVLIFTHEPFVIFDLPCPVE